MSDKKTVPFNEAAQIKYLDNAIIYWREVRDTDKRPDLKQFAAYYIDAFQSVRLSFFGEALQPEGGEGNGVQEFTVTPPSNYPN